MTSQRVLLLLFLNRTSDVLVSDILILDPELLHEVLTRGPVGQPMYSIAMLNAYGNLELRLKLRASIRRQAVLAQIHRRALALLLLREFRRQRAYEYVLPPADACKSQLCIVPPSRLPQSSVHLQIRVLHSNSKGQQPNTAARFAVRCARAGICVG